MRAARRSSCSSCSRRNETYRLVCTILVILFFITTGHASTQLTLKPGEPPVQGEHVGVIDLVVDPGVEEARVWITVDGQKIAQGLGWPHRVTVDLGPTAVEHQVTVTAIGRSRQRVQWRETINRGHLPLSVRVKPLDLAARRFEAKTTAPQSDAIVAVEVWHRGDRIVGMSEPPFRFEVPEEVILHGFVQVTARTREGHEAAGFWSPAGEIHVEAIQVRTVPLFVSVVDRNGTTQDDLDAGLFRIMDNGAEGRIVEFGNAFDQPISIALLLDSSASMLYTMSQASNAAQEFVRRTLKSGDRCSVTAIQDVPRRKQSLTDDLAHVASALERFRPSGSTALYDAIAAAVRELKDEDRRRAVVALTDGDDTGSMTSFDEIEKIAAQSGIPIYFIAYRTGTDTHSRDLERLRHLSAQTGGFTVVASPETLRAKYGEIERDLRAQFAILYQVTDFVRAKEWRRVRVTLASPKLTARTISGYFTP